MSQEMITCDSCGLVPESYRAGGKFHICTECMNKEFEFWLNSGYEFDINLGDWSSQESVLIPVLNGVKGLENAEPMTPFQNLYTKLFNTPKDHNRQIYDRPIPERSRLNEARYQYNRSHGMFRDGFVIQISEVRYNKN